MDAAKKMFDEVVGQAVNDRGYWQVVPDWIWIERALIVLHNEKSLWQFNLPDTGNLWRLQAGEFVRWLKGWNDIKALFGDEHPMTYTNAATAARHYALQGGLSLPKVCPDALPYWLIQPVNCVELLERESYVNGFYVVRLSRSIFDASVPVIAAEILEPKRGRKKSEW